MLISSKWAKARLFIVGVILGGCLRVGDAVGGDAPYGPAVAPTQVQEDYTIPLEVPAGITPPPDVSVAGTSTGSNPYAPPTTPSGLQCRGFQRKGPADNYNSDGGWFGNAVPSGSGCSRIIPFMDDGILAYFLGTDVPTLQSELVWREGVPDDYRYNPCKVFPYTQVPLASRKPAITCNCECRGGGCSRRDLEWDDDKGLTKAEFTPCKRIKSLANPPAGGFQNSQGRLSCAAKYASKAELCDPICARYAVESGRCTGELSLLEVLINAWPFSQATSGTAVVGVGVTCAAAYQAFRVGGQPLIRPAMVGATAGRLSGRVATVTASVGLTGPILGALLIVLTDAAPCSAAEIYQLSDRLNDCSYKAGVLAELLLQFDWWCGTTFPDEERQRLYDAQQALLANWDQTCGGQVLSTLPLDNSDLLWKFEELNDFVGGLRTCSKPTCMQFSEVCPLFSAEMACFNQVAASSTSGPSFAELRNQLTADPHFQTALAQSCPLNPQASQPPLVASPVPEKLG